MFRRSADDRSHAVGEQLHLLPTQRQGGARRQRPDELRGAGGGSPGPAQRLHAGRKAAAALDLFSLSSVC